MKKSKAEKYDPARSLELYQRYARVLARMDEERRLYGDIRYRDAESEVLNRFLGAINFCAASTGENQGHAAWALACLERTLADIASRRSLDLPAGGGA